MPQTRFAADRLGPTSSGRSSRGTAAAPFPGRSIIGRIRPHPAAPEWPYFDRERYLDSRYKIGRRWRPLADTDDARAPDRGLDEADTGFWCGAITDHFGHMIAEFGMRLAAWSRLDPAASLVFSMPGGPVAPPLTCEDRSPRRLGNVPEPSNLFLHGSCLGRPSIG